MAVKIVNGLIFGDETKGATVDYVTASDGATLVVRYNGGSQAAHNVVTPEGLHHTFSMFGAGTLAGARTHLSRFVRVNPYDVWHEAKELYDKGVDRPFDLMTVDENCVITTPLHVAHSQYQAPIHKRGTCGMGVGVSARYAEKYPFLSIYAGDLSNQHVLTEKLERMAAYYSTAIDGTDLIRDIDVELPQIVDVLMQFGRSVKITNESDWADMLRQNENIVFEGAQGVLLDRTRGFVPNVTSSNTTPENALELLRGYRDDITVIGVIRSYMTRHGVGYFPSECAGISQFTNERHNTANKYQGDFREGWFDAALMRLSMGIGHVDVLSVSHLDCISETAGWTIVDSDNDMQITIHNAEQFINWIQETFGIPVAYTAYGERRNDRSIL